MTCGSDQAAVVSETDATVTERLLDAGARLVGKANMDAFAFGPSGEFSDYGTVMNPLNADRVPGGSSAGSGAAIAADTADPRSVRTPAAQFGSRRHVAGWWEQNRLTGWYPGTASSPLHRRWTLSVH